MRADVAARPPGPEPLAGAAPAPARPGLGERFRAHLDPRHSASRYASLDGYRAAAALGVVVYHVSGYANLSFGDGALAKVLHNLGNFGVATFFLLSGFLLYRPFVAAALAGAEAPDPFSFLWRRLLRIWPAYALALGAYLVIGLDRTRSPAPDYYFTLASLTQVYRKAFGFAGLAVAWTLCIEVAFYLALPLLAGAIRGLARSAGRGPVSERARLQAQLLGLATMAGVALIYRWFVAGPAQFDVATYPFAVFHLWLPNFLDWFALGMALAVAVVWRDRGHPLPAVLRNLADAGWPCWALAAACYAALAIVRGGGVDDLGAQVHETTGQMFARFALNGVGAFFFLLPGILGPARHLLNRALSSLVPMYLGTISYGIYLWHTVWLNRIRVDHDAPRDRLGFWVMLALVVGGSLLTATASYYLVERPLLRLAARSRRRRAAAGPPVTARAGAEVT